MLRYPQTSDATTFVVATETGLLHQLGKLYPDRKFIPASSRAICPNMKRNTLEKAVAALGDEWGDAPGHQVVVPEPIRVKALAAVERMLG
jgi:quinolinate synthase